MSHVPEGDLDFEALMEEPPGGLNYGRMDGAPLSVEAAQAEEFMQRGGFGLVETGRGGNRRSTYGDQDAGMTTHRGVNRGDENIDLGAVQALVVTNLGATMNEIAEAYANGRPTADRARTRARIDARLLALSRAGGNMTALARVLGWEIDGTGSCWKMKQALARARAAEVAA